MWGQAGEDPGIFNLYTVQKGTVGFTRRSHIDGIQPVARTVGRLQKSYTRGRRMKIPATTRNQTIVFRSLAHYLQNELPKCINLILIKIITYYYNSKIYNFVSINQSDRTSDLPHTYNGFHIMILLAIQQLLRTQMQRLTSDSSQ